jgi:predicted Fe-Mo cluster-binding NifX family protein
MKIAVTSQNDRSVTPHAGRTRRFLAYTIDETGKPVEADRLDLAKTLSLHEFHGEGPHPLDAVDVLLAGSFGEGFVRRMAGRGITAVTTEKTDPVEAVNEYLARLRTGAEGPPSATCGGGHHHQHGHGRRRSPPSALPQPHGGQG